MQLVTLDFLNFVMILLFENFVYSLTNFHGKSCITNKLSFILAHKIVCHGPQGAKIF